MYQICAVRHFIFQRVISQITAQSGKFAQKISFQEVIITGKTNKLKYQTAEEMSEAIEKYFKDCEGKVLIDDKGKAVTDKYGQPVIVGAHPPTVTGLALALGFKTRQSLLNYQARTAAFDDILTVAKSRCEEYAERRLYDRDGVNGAKFSLANNFRGWREHPEQNENGGEVIIIDDITK